MKEEKITRVSEGKDKIEITGLSAN